ncbi:MAG: type IX secretion system protein PorG [Bacteroidia bacterium]
MKPFKILLTAAAFVATAFTVNAQDREAGIFLGTASYQGDLSKKQVTLSETKPGFGILGRYYFNPRINLKGALSYGWIEGDDKNYGSATDPDPDGRWKRNLSFRSHVLELSGQVELNILPFISNSKRYRFAPYIFTGVSLYHFDPKTKTAAGDWVKLQPLGTEGQLLNGQDKRYNRLQGAIPYGFGLKYSLGNFWNIGLEVGQRKLFTDHLDDVSGYEGSQGGRGYAPIDQLTDPLAKELSFRGDEVGISPNQQVIRGDNKDLDMYIYAGFTITKTIRRFTCTNF